MVDPYKCKDLVLKIDDQVIAVVESASIELEREGGLEPYYNSEEEAHAMGTKRASFTIRRWYGVDSDVDLLFDLFDNKTAFTLSDEINGVSGTKLILSNCKIYRWRPVMGAANDIVAEEASGYATSWSGLT